MGKFMANPEDRFRTVPAGEYEVIIQKAELVTKEGKNPYISVDFVVTEGEHKNQHIFDNISLSEKEGAKRRLNGFLYACGMNRGDGEYDTDELVGMMLTVKCVIEEYNGVERARPSSFKASQFAKETPPQAAPSASTATKPAPAPAQRPVAATAVRKPV